MVDWNRLMADGLTNLIPNKEKRESIKTKTKKIIKILEENKITNVGKNTPYTKNDKKINV